MEQLLKSKNTMNNDQWQCFLNNLAPILPALYSYANQSSTLGQIIFNLFDPDHSEKFNIKKLVVCFYLFLMIYIFVFSEFYLVSSHYIKLIFEVIPLCVLKM